LRSAWVSSTTSGTRSASTANSEQHGTPTLTVSYGPLHDCDNHQRRSGRAGGHGWRRPRLMGSYLLSERQWH
jgi:hypothetical protein